MSYVPRISVVVLSRDRGDELLRTLERLSELPERPPIVVVDNGSRDGTQAVVPRSFPGVELVALDRDLGAAARNVGVERADAPYVAFCDDDSWWAPGALPRALELMVQRPRLGLLAARVLVGPEERLDPTCAAMDRTPLPDRGVLGFVACGAVVRRDAFLEAGGFDERYGIGGEEQLLAVRLASAGWELCYAPDVVAHHHPTPSATRTGREARALRNDLWTAWRTRPWASAVCASARLVRSAGPRGATVAGVAGALRGIGWVLRERRPAPSGVQDGLRLLERQADRAL